jgi:non-specific protein-tyrosine kinase
VARSEAQSLDLRSYLGVLRRRRLLVALVALAALAAGLLASYLQSPVYEAHADVLVQANTTDSAFSDTQARPAVNAIETETEVLNSDAVRSQVRSDLGSAPPISAGRVGSTEVMRVTARSGTPSLAARIANAYADAYVAYRKQRAVGDIEAASRGIEGTIKDLQSQMDALDKRISSASSADKASTEASLRPVYNKLLDQQAVLAQKLDQLHIDATLTSGGASVVRSALVPGSPASPKPIRNGVAALFVGLLLGAALAFVRENFDDAIWDKRQLGEAVDVPVLAVVPALHRSSKDVRAELRRANSPSVEAFRRLRTSLQLLGVERPLRTIQVTSPVAGEGKTTVVSALGLLLASTGQRVVLVDCDLRRPRLHDEFGFTNDVGVTSVLAGELALADAVRQVPDSTSLYVLASGPLPPNPAELMASRRMAELLFELQSRFDLILVDSAPVLPVTDATLLAAWVEATVLVTKAGSTTVRQLVDAVEQLRQVEAQLAGTVLNQAEVDAGYGYYYAENGSSRRRSQSPATPRRDTPQGLVG